MLGITKVQCPECGYTVFVEIRDVVDLEDEPNLRQQLLAGSINYVVCPHCGFNGQTDKAFLVNDPTNRQVIFVIPNQPDRIVWKQILRNILTVILPKREYFEHPIEVETWAELVKFLNSASNESKISEHDKWVDLKYLHTFLMAPTWEERRRYIFEAPHMLDDASLIQLTRQIRFARQQEGSEILRLLLLGRNILERCRLVGVKKAIEEFSAIIQLDSSDSGELVARYTYDGIDKFEGFQLDTLKSLTKPHYQTPEHLPYVIERLTEVLEGPYLSEEPEVRAIYLALLGSTHRRFVGGNRASSLRAAIQYMNEALHYHESQGLKTGLHLGLLNELGLAYLELPADDRTVNLNRALAHFNRVFEVDTLGEYPESQAASHNNLGMAYSRFQTTDRGRALTISLEHFKAALQFLDPDRSPDEYAKTMNNQGTVFMQLMETDPRFARDALACFDAALSVWEPRNNTEELRAACHINAAKAALRTSSSDEEQRRADSLKRAKMALSLLGDGSPAEYTSGANEAIATAYAAPGVGCDLDAALHYLKTALTTINVNTFPAEVRRIRQRLGDIYLQSRDWKGATSSYEEALIAHATLYAAASFDTARLGEIASISTLYACFAYALTRTGDIEGALVQLEAGKTQIVAQRLQLKAPSLQDLSDTEREAFLGARTEVNEYELRLQELDVSWGVLGTTASRADIAHTKDALQKARQRLHELIGQIRERIPGFLVENWSAKDLYNSVSLGGAFVAPMFTPAGSALIIVPHGTKDLQANHVVWIDQSKTDIVDVLLYGGEDPGWLAAYQNYRQTPSRFFKVRWEDVVAQVGQNLWDMLIGPLHERLMDLGLEHGATVSFVPQGGLGLLPLHAAWREEAGSRRYFVDDWVVSYAPSIKVNSVCHERLRRIDGKSGPNLLMVAVPGNDLTYAAQEGKAVASLFPVHRSLTGDEATRDQVQATVGNHDYLHFACHGVYDSENPLRSRLRVAGEAPLDVRYIDDNLDLSRARLITLSACETGITDVRLAADEYIGLPSVFLMSGGAGLVSSLWLVDDAATALLMVRFYQAHVHEGLLPAAALREAQLWLRTRTTSQIKEEIDDIMEFNELTDLMGGEATSRPYPYANPYYWAAFSVTGV